MSSVRDERILLEEMLEALESIQRFIQAMDFKAFSASDLHASAVLRKLEVIGEASRQMPEFFREKHPEIHWFGLRGLRNRIIHEYFDISLSVIWEIITEEAPILEERVRNITQSLSNSKPTP